MDPWQYSLRAFHEAYVACLENQWSQTGMIRYQVAQAFSSKRVKPDQFIPKFRSGQRPTARKMTKEQSLAHLDRLYKHGK